LVSAEERVAVRKDFESVLRTMEQATGRQKILARCAALVSGRSRFPQTFRIFASAPFPI